MFYCIFINKGKCPMSQKMPIFPKKALKMPGWQHCSLGRGRGRLSLSLFLSPATFPPVPFNTLSVSLMPPPRAEEATQRGSPESGGGPSSAPPPLGPSPWIPFASVNVALSQCLHRTVEGVKGTLWDGRTGGRHFYWAEESGGRRHGVEGRQQGGKGVGATRKCILV